MLLAERTLAYTGVMQARVIEMQQAEENGELPEPEVDEDEDWDDEDEPVDEFLDGIPMEAM